MGSMKLVTPSPTLLVHFACALVLAGCGPSDETETPPATCAHVVGAACTGLPPAPVCDADPCTAGVSCSKTITVGPEQLDAAASSASPVTCLALGPGNYGAV